MSAVAPRYTVLRLVESREESEDCVAHYKVMSYLTPILGREGGNLQTERTAGIVSSFSKSERSAAVAFCLRYEEDWLFGSDFDILD